MYDVVPVTGDRVMYERVLDRIGLGVALGLSYL